MKPGERFTPIRDFIMRRSDLTFGAKCLLGRLERYAQGGKCNPSLPTLGGELAISADQAKRYIVQLKNAGLVRSETVGRGRGNSTNYVLCSMKEKGATLLGFLHRKKGAITPSKETIVGRKRQFKKQDRRHGFSHESDRPPNNGFYQPSMADAEALRRLM